MYFVFFVDQNDSIYLLLDLFIKQLTLTLLTLEIKKVETSNQCLFFSNVYRCPKTVRYVWYFRVDQVPRADHEIRKPRPGSEYNGK